MSCPIAYVTPHGIADRLGIRAGDHLISIDGEPIIDQIDYQALVAQARFAITVRREQRFITFQVRKADWEPLGITLDQSIVLAPRECANHCIFCFIDQMPPGFRRTLYVKDDDWRLSLMMGNFITMTNVSDHEFDRILRRGVSPLFISVHATNPEVRRQLLRNDRAGQLMPRLRRLKENGQRFHCQVVLCPGWNDGEVLAETIRDLRSLYPAAQSVALVPVGLTRFREGLAKIEPYGRETATELVRQAEEWQRAFLQDINTRFVFPSDEFYCLSGLPLPADEAYEGYPQIENGVGMLRMFETDLAYAVEDFPCAQTPPRRLVIACGTSVAATMQGWCDRYAPQGTTVRVQPIRNTFFGESVTVTGLITGGDLMAQLQNVQCDEILICRNMLRTEGDLFLDDTSVSQVRAALPAPLRIVENTGEAFWKAIAGLTDKEPT